MSDGAKGRLSKKDCVESICCSKTDASDDGMEKGSSSSRVESEMVKSDWNP